MDHLGVEQAHVLGHSMGGRVAQWIALDNPNRVRSLVLASTGSGNFKKSDQYVRGIPLATAFEIAKFGFEKYFHRHVRGDFFYTPRFLKSRSLQLRMAVAAHITDLPPAKTYLRHVMARQMHETSNRVSEIHAPTLITVGDMDTDSRGTGSHYEASEWLAKNIRGSTFVAIKGAKHGTFWEKPDQSNATVGQFISSYD
jgi:pimeloyl-ACP methyl ester carboxylesterase